MSTLPVSRHALSRNFSAYGFPLILGPSTKRHDTTCARWIFCVVHFSVVRTYLPLSEGALFLLANSRETAGTIVDDRGRWYGVGNARSYVSRLALLFIELFRDRRNNRVGRVESDHDDDDHDNDGDGGDCDDDDDDVGNDGNKEYRSQR